MFLVESFYENNFLFIKSRKTEEEFNDWLQLDLYTAADHLTLVLSYIEFIICTLAMPLVPK